MLRFNKLTSNCLTNKKKIELKSISDEKPDKKRTKIEWQRMSSRRSMIDKDEKTT